VKHSSNSGPVRHFKSGDVVEVLSVEEIAATLDEHGSYESLPFTAEMRQFCGRRFRVFKRADKICMETAYSLDLRRLSDAVTLEEVRCDGSDHDGCRRMCLLFWKERWLKPAPAAIPEPPIDWTSILASRDASPRPPVVPGTVYACQATALPAATTPLRIWDARHYLRDLRSRGVRPHHLPKIWFMAVYNTLARRMGRADFGMLMGTQAKTPAISLDLKPGEIVRIRTKPEVRETLDTVGKNRGLYFGNEETSRHCGKTYPVLTRIDRMILEDSGQMRGINHTVLLRGTECSGLCFGGCARGGYPMWREAWLERVDQRPSSSASASAVAETALEATLTR
jgi:hypothetical protein